ncbi:hypothetical protein [Amycolatopsis sp. YIM 10]|uniref:hypothetical protein n=1 Tax=Amycolatopsis sp. YIM 10 TaxID=2653857 RepID=UPI0012902C69|nr:hypothetical protein [Amycolatopsis sp. YIM 10]QFU87850.1 hypothetical protein YIM_13320 [Amycolatopsis sp. YIM 10]QFU94837.1 hypothetical protein YIM_48560 [Amycolatopsis sp. YIM 10]
MSTREAWRRRRHIWHEALRSLARTATATRRQGTTPDFTEMTDARAAAEAALTRKRFR